MTLGDVIKTAIEPALAILPPGLRVCSEGFDDGLRLFLDLLMLLRLTGHKMTLQLCNLAFELLHVRIDLRRGLSRSGKIHSKLPGELAEQLHLLVGIRRAQHVGGLEKILNSADGLATLRADDRQIRANCLVHLLAEGGVLAQRDDALMGFFLAAGNHRLHFGWYAHHRTKERSPRGD